MRTDYTSPLDYAEVRIRIVNHISLMRETAAVVRIALDSMARFDGKPINKRLATAVSDGLAKSRTGSYVVTLDYVAGMHYLRVWNRTPNAALDYPHRLSIFMGYNADSAYRAAYMVQPADLETVPYRERKNQGPAVCYLVQAEQADRLESTLTGLAKRVAAFNRSLAAHKITTANVAGSFGFIAFNRDN